MTNIHLNPQERVASHRLLFPSTIDHTTNETDLGDGLSSLESIVYNSTIKAITALSVLWDETHELEEIAFNEFLPQIVLSGSDLQLHVFNKSSLSPNSTKVSGTLYGNNLSNSSTTHLLDEISTQKRDSELLRRMGLFLPVLQNIHNFTTRCQRLLRNMVCQVGGSTLPYDYNQIRSTRENNAHTMDMNESNLQSSFDDLPPNSNGSSSKSEATFSNRLSTESESTFGRGTHLVPLGKAIATTLKIFISIDYAITNNNQLREAWDLYKCVVTDKSKQVQKKILTMENLAHWSFLKEC